MPRVYYVNFLENINVVFISTGELTMVEWDISV